MALKLKTDWILFTTILVMLFFGAVMLYSASSVMAQLKYGSSWHFFYRQLAWMAVAISVMMVLKRTNYRKLQNPAVAFPAVGIALMLLLVVYFADPNHHRWIRLGSVVGIQPRGHRSDFKRDWQRGERGRCRDSHGSRGESHSD